MLDETIQNARCSSSSKAASQKCKELIHYETDFSCGYILYHGNKLLKNVYEFKGVIPNFSKGEGIK